MARRGHVSKTRSDTGLYRKRYRWVGSKKDAYSSPAVLAKEQRDTQTFHTARAVTWNQLYGPCFELLFLLSFLFSSICMHRFHDITTIHRSFQ